MGSSDINGSVNGHTDVENSIKHRESSEERRNRKLKERKHKENETEEERRLRKEREKKLAKKGIETRLKMNVEIGKIGKAEREERSLMKRELREKIVNERKEMKDISMKQKKNVN